MTYERVCSRAWSACALHLIPLTSIIASTEEARDVRPFPHMP